MKKAVALCVFLALAASGHAEVGDLTPVTVPPRPAPPKIEVLDASGNKVYDGKMRYG